MSVPKDCLPKGTKVYLEGLSTHSGKKGVVKSFVNENDLQLMVVECDGSKYKLKPINVVPEGCYARSSDVIVTKLSDKQFIKYNDTPATVVEYSIQRGLVCTKVRLYEDNNVIVLEPSQCVPRYPKGEAEIYGLKEGPNGEYCKIVGMATKDNVNLYKLQVGDKVMHARAKNVRPRTPEGLHPIGTTATVFGLVKAVTLNDTKVKVIGHVQNPNDGTYNYRMKTEEGKTQVCCLMCVGG